MRYLAIDLGDKRTGLAVGDDETGQVFPVEVVETGVGADGGAALLRDLGEAVDRHLGARAGRERRAALVIGLPINMDGTEGARAKMVRALGERVAAATGLRAHYQDERLTSAAADWVMAGTGLTRGAKKAKRDALAAAEILRDFLRARSSPGTGAADEEA